MTTTEDTTTVPASKRALQLSQDKSYALPGRANSFKVMPGSKDPKSVCVVYVPASEPIADGYTGVLNVAGGGQSNPVRPMNVEIVEEFDTPIESNNPRIPPQRYSNQYYSMDLWPGANFDIKFELWSRAVQLYPHLQRALDENFIQVFHTKQTWKGSANTSMAFKDTDALKIVRQTWDLEILETWDRSEERDSVRRAINSQQEQIRKSERRSRGA